jgi:hypothetical protein
MAGTDMDYKDYIVYIKPGDSPCEQLLELMSQRGLLEDAMVQDAMQIKQRPQWLTGVPILIHQTPGNKEKNVEPSRTAYRGSEAFRFVTAKAVEPQSFAGFGSSLGNNLFNSVAYGFGEKGNDKGTVIADATGSSAARLGIGHGAHKFDSKTYGFGQKGSQTLVIAGAIDEDAAVPPPPPQQQQQRRQQQPEYFAGGAAAGYYE